MRIMLPLLDNAILPFAPRLDVPLLRAPREQAECSSGIRRLLDGSTMLTTLGEQPRLAAFGGPALLGRGVYADYITEGDGGKAAPLRRPVPSSVTNVVPLRRPG